MEDIIGAIAATLTTVSFIPQVVRIIRTKHTQDISLSMYIIFTIGVALWLVYGIILGKLPIIVANVVTLLLTGIILYFKLMDEVEK